MSVQRQQYVMIQERTAPAMADAVHAIISLIRRFRDSAYRDSNIYAAYLSTLLYLEIIYVMVIMLFILGLVPSILTGGVLTLLYTAHLIRLYFRRNIDRILQLVIMEVHCAYTIGFLYNSFQQGFDGNPMAVVTVVVRTAILIAEIPLIVLLTSDRVIPAYD